MSILAQYQKHLADNNIILDAAQTALLHQLVDFHKYYITSTKKKSLLDKLFKNNLPSRNIYLFGKVGRGKTMLANLLYDFLPTDKKNRTHYQAFMLDVHNQLFNIRASLSSKNIVDDNITLVTLAGNIAKKYDFMYIDELQITDIVDATIVSKLIRELTSKGVFILLTSNRVPEDLYKEGIHREHFIWFIKFIRQKFQVIELLSLEDYRLTKQSSLIKKYYHPSSDENHRSIDSILMSLLKGEKLSPATLMVQGREFLVNRIYQDIAVFNFAELCDQPLSSGDYIEICRNFKNVFLLNIPQLSSAERNQAKRFTLLIDALYEHKVKLYCLAAVELNYLYLEGDGSFEFERTISRLIEMQSDEY